MFRYDSWLARLGLASIRGRYLYAAVILSLLLLLAAAVGHHLVRDATHRSIGNTGEREQLRQGLRAISDQLWNSQSALQGYMIAPEPDAQASVLQCLDDARSGVAHLNASLAIADDPDHQARLARLDAKLQRLHREVARVMEVRGQAERLYPAIPIMRDTLLPAHSRFYTSAALALREAEEFSELPSQQEIHRVFAEAQHQWTMMIMSFRTWVSARFGIFAEAASSQEAESHNVAFYHEGVARRLARLAELERQGRLEFVQTESLAHMREASALWHQAFLEVKRIYLSPQWRTDLPLLQHVIRPLATDIWEDVRAFDKHLDAVAANDLGAVAVTADDLSRALWYIVILCLVAIALGFFLFEYTVSRPIAQVAQALKAEGAGVPGAPLPVTATIETRNLVEAFDHMRNQVNARQTRLETILDNAAEGILTFDERGCIQTFNDAAQRLFGYREDEIVGKDITTIIRADGAERREAYLDQFMRFEINRLIGHEGEVLGRDKDGVQFHAALKISAITLEGNKLYTGLVADISERKAMLQRLKDLAEHDALTGLYNRNYFESELERMVDRARQPGTKAGAVLYIDLDHFKYVNDTWGHAAGDRLLVEVAALLSRRARRSELIARFGGDEFTVLVYDTTPDVAHKVAEAFREQMTDYVFRQGAERVEVGCSIGVSMIGPDTRSAADALSQADVACHHAKREGRNRVRFYNPLDKADLASMSLDMGWSRRIRHAIQRGGLALSCQPVVSLATGKPAYYEVLVRMYDENGELIMPSGFFPSAERFGLAVDIDRWIIAEAIDNLALRRRQVPGLRYSLNLSGITLSDLGVVELVKAKLAEHALDAQALVFEVTETAAIADVARAQTFLEKLRAIGCHTALDDFGSGLSSFAYLQDLPVDCVKIDGRFVRNMAQNPVDQAMVKAMNEIAHALGKHTVAEFVEDAESLELLRAYGVDYAQGFYLGRPEIVTAVPASPSAASAASPSRA